MATGGLLVVAERNHWQLAPPGAAAAPCLGADETPEPIDLKRGRCRPTDDAGQFA
jgi:hypothetical protein